MLSEVAFLLLYIFVVYDLKKNNKKKYLFSCLLGVGLIPAGRQRLMTCREKEQNNMYASWSVFQPVLILISSLFVWV